MTAMIDFTHTVHLVMRIILSSYGSSLTSLPFIKRIVLMPL